LENDFLKWTSGYILQAHYFSKLTKIYNTKVRKHTVPERERIFNKDDIVFLSVIDKKKATFQFTFEQ